MAKKMSRKDAEACLTDCGIDAKAIDWSKITFAKIMEIVMAIISLFKSAPQAQKAVGDHEDDGCTVEEACAAHFAAIQELAACGQACCESGEE